MVMRTGRTTAAVAMILVMALGAVACTSDDAVTDASGEADAQVLQVPQDHDTIQAAVDAAKAGDLILVDEGTYNEAVDVTTRPTSPSGASTATR